MNRSKTIITAALLLLVVHPLDAQKLQLVPVCRRATFAAVKPLPKLEYDCPEGLNDSDDEILKLPARVAALETLTKELASFTDAAWWQASVNELCACDLHGRSGSLTDDEKEKFREGDYEHRVQGNHQIRLVITPDPCYQTGYSGSVISLLYRKGGKVLATQLRDGYYSRLDDSVGIAFATLHGQQIIEISTVNNMPPQETNYYFAIDPSTNKVVPKKLFKISGKLTNEITSAMIIGEPSELGLPQNSVDTRILRGHRLAPSISVYAEAFSSENSDRRLSRTVYRWNGRYYAARR